MQVHSSLKMVRQEARLAKVFGKLDFLARAVSMRVGTQCCSCTADHHVSWVVIEIRKLRNETPFLVLGHCQLVEISKEPTGSSSAMFIVTAWTLHRT